MLRIGLIGCGYIARKHLQTLTIFDDLQLVAVSDIQREKMEECIELYAKQKRSQTQMVISRYEDYNDMMKDKSIDVIIICVMSSMHADIAQQAVKHNKHVIIEKPLALSLEEAEKIINLAKERKRKVLVCHQLRYRPLIQKIKQIIKEGYLGELYLGVVSLRLNRSEDYYASSPWKGTWEKDGGMLINQGIHLIDILIWLMGDIVSVYGEITTKVKNKETEDIAIGILTFENHAKGLIEANTITKPKNQGYFLSIFGKKGSICIGGKGFNQIEHCYIENHPELETELKRLCEQTNEHERMYQNFRQACISNERMIVAPEESKKALEAIFGVYLSQLTHQKVIFPLENFSTTEMLDQREED